MMSQQLLNPCPLHHRPFAAQPLHRITCSWRGKGLPVQKSTAPRKSKGLTWTVYARRPSNPLEEQRDARIGIRSEVEAPFRALRLVFFGFFTLSASIGAAIAITQVIGAIGNAPGALPLTDVATSLAIDLGAVALFAFLLRNDLKARDKQIARLTREERLGALQLGLANGKRIRVAQLRSFSRAVIAAGSPQQVADAMKEAEQFREPLLERGVLVIPLPIYEGNAAPPEENGAGSTESSDDQTKSNLRWRATPVNLEQWKAWFKEQADLAGAKIDRGLYVSLRLDGRVRGSGLGPPPWQRLIAQLPKAEGDGAWKGFLDGFDGSVNIR
ncbi:hypothetical protein CVIRNUC_002521 [Coccomyxa viridis]|uniref:Uncharacterized protein n=1 Tax=Coccomyxa viridis TaxID=1274662 RepID=A0AAV1HX37_9CHLO|nr:hypothetical protein CVIRNUC_002521 [Coccomyxa viridis]